MGNRAQPYGRAKFRLRAHVWIYHLITVQNLPPVIDRWLAHYASEHLS